MENRTEQLEKLRGLIGELDLNISEQSLIQDNKIIFFHDNKCYRCKMPNQLEQNLAENRQNELKVELIQKDNTITKKKLIKVLKEKQDVDIKELEKEQNTIKKELEECYLELAVKLSDDTEEIEELKDKKKELENKFLNIVIEISDYLSPCIEERVKIEYFKFLTPVCTQKLIQGKNSGEESWEKAWGSREEFDKDDSGLSYKALDAMQALLLNVRS